MAAERLTQGCDSGECRPCEGGGQRPEPSAARGGSCDDGELILIASWEKEQLPWVPGRGTRDVSVSGLACKVAPGGGVRSWDLTGRLQRFL